MNKYTEDKEGKGTLYKQKDKEREAGKIGQEASRSQARG
jgi:hypothetical protein